LQEAELLARVALKKKQLTDEEKRKRLSFAGGYSSWSEDDWDKVLFADEATVEGAGTRSCGRIWVRRAKGTKEALKSEHCAGTVQHPVKVGVWGCFSGRGLGYSYIYNENMNKKLMKSVLSTHLIPSAQLLFKQDPPEPWWLLQDNAPTHSAHLVQHWLHNHGIALIDFPPYSPDLNPIENLWQDIEKRVEARGPTELELLQDVVAEEWAKTPTEFLRKLAHSMPKRCRLVIEAQGDYIHY
jgi:hypothetical protein